MNEDLKKISDILWEQRADILVIRKPKWVIKHIFVIPAFTGLILILSESYKTITTILISLAFIFVIYSIFTYFKWKNWDIKGENQRKFCILMIMIYDGFLLGSISILFLISANLSLKWINPIWIKWAGIVSCSLYLLLSIFFLINGKSAVEYLIKKHENPLPPRTKLAMAIQSFLVGLGISLGAILKSSQFGLILSSGLSYLVSYLLLPFIVIAFYQVFLMIRNR